MKPFAPLRAACAASIALALFSLFALPAAAQDALPPLPPSQPAPAPPPAPAPLAAPPPPPDAPPPVIIAEPGAEGESEPREHEAKGAAPRASRGFQLHAGLGYSHPFGRVSNDDGTMSELSGGQFMLLDLGIGGKIGRYFYIGAYLSVAGGGSPSSSCNGCSSASAHLGIEAQYFFSPEAKWDPWIGYGLGVEGASAGSDRVSVTYTGFEFARLTAGVDARLTRAFGLGPYLGFSFARYSDREVQTTANTDIKSSIENRTVHGWFTLGVRVVIFP